MPEPSTEEGVRGCDLQVIGGIGPFAASAGPCGAEMGFVGSGIGGEADIAINAECLCDRSS